MSSNPETQRPAGWRDVIQAMKQGVYSHLFLSLLLLWLMYPLLSIENYGSAIWTLGLWLVLLGAMRVCPKSRRDRIAARWLFGSVLLLGAFQKVSEFEGVKLEGGQLNALHFVVLVLSLAFFLLVARVILFDVLGAGRVTVDKIFGSVCFYVLLGLIGGFAFALVDVVSGGESLLVPLVATVEGLPVVEARFIAPTERNMQHYLYFSFVSLTTVGYGDIRPVLPASRMLAIGISIAGPLYLTILVARLVGLHLSQEGLVEKDE